VSEAPPFVLSPSLLIAAYARGFFPMAHDDGLLYWHDPDPRAVFPLDAVRPNARLSTFIRAQGYRCTVDHRFEAVMRACADRESTWITEEMILAYTELHRAGYAHSVETWKDGELIGGIYGLSLGGAFFGESMFSRATNASKVAFHHLAEHLRQQGFTLFDSQYINDHTRSLGAVEIPRSQFGAMLAEALSVNTHF
jgi:leucyl/phenylalanyl-tRNA---protein transferase